MRIDSTQFVRMIDQALLKPDVTLEDLAAFAETCRTYQFKLACVNSCHVAALNRLLEGSGVLVGATVGFPFGTASSEAKCAEAHAAIADGADELDMVINIGLLRSGKEAAVRADIAGVVRQAQGHPVKVILENCYLTDEQKRLGCRLVVEAGAQFAKTSTGLATGGATVEDVALMREATTGTPVHIKAAGGIRDAATALAMIRAGASRLGISTGDRIADEFRSLYPEGVEL